MKVVIGISGGVDSSVGAYILKKQGYEVIGITYKMLENVDMGDAIKVCNELGIEHHIIDISDTFKKEIIDTFLSDYKNGLTPNPCVLCNRIIKFKYLNDALKEYGADYIATGHYIKVIDNGLYKSDDLEKDQSYFLYGLDKEIISKLIFPLQGLTKEEVRKIAIENNLVTATKKDSYDVCFIKDDFKGFIKENLGVKKGKVINIDTGKVIGEHNGLMFYTIGQRKGLNIGGHQDKLYVVDKDIDNNILYVCENAENDHLFSSAIIVSNVNFNCDLRPKECYAKFRYRQNDIKVNIEYLSDCNLLVTFDKIKAVTKGQSCVLYMDDRCIGGGIISKIIVK